MLSCDVMAWVYKTWIWVFLLQHIFCGWVFLPQIHTIFQNKNAHKINLRQKGKNIYTIGQCFVFGSVDPGLFGWIRIHFWIWIHISRSYAVLIEFLEIFENLSRESNVFFLSQGLNLWPKNVIFSQFDYVALSLKMELTKNLNLFTT